MRVGTPDPSSPNPMWLGICNAITTYWLEDGILKTLSLDSYILSLPLWWWTFLSPESDKINMKFRAELAILTYFFLLLYKWIAIIQVCWQAHLCFSRLSLIIILFESLLVFCLEIESQVICLLNNLLYPSDNTLYM